MKCRHLKIQTAAVTSAILLVAATCCAFSHPASSDAINAGSAYAAFNAGKFKEASQRFAIELTGNQSDLGLRLSYAVTLLQLKEYDKADAELQAARTIAPNAEIIQRLINTSARERRSVIGGSIMTFNLSNVSQPPVTSSGGPDVSVPALLEASEKNPESAVVANLLGDTYQLQGDLASSEKWYRKAASLAPGWTRPLLGLAVASIQYDPGKAANLLEEVLRREPDNSRARLWLGDAYQKLGRSKEALEMYKRAVTNQRTRADAQVRLGNAYLRQKDFKQAQVQFETANTVDPSNYAASVGRAQVYGYYQKNAPKAQKAMQQAQESAMIAEADPQTQAALYLNGAQIAPSAPEAISNLERAKSLAPDLQAAFSYVARMFERQGTLVQNNVLYERKLLENPNDVGAMRYLVEGYEVSKQYDRQVQILNRLAELDPKQVWNWKARQASAHWNAGEKQKAANLWLASGLLAYPVHTPAVARVIVSHKGAGTMVMDIVAGLQDEEEQVKGRHLVFAITQQMGNLKDALEHINAVIAKDPENSTLYGQRGNLLLQMKRVKEAEADLARQRELLLLEPPPPPASG